MLLKSAGLIALATSVIYTLISINQALNAWQAAIMARYGIF